MGYPNLDLAQRIGAWAHAFEATPERLRRIKASVHDFAGCVAAGTRRPELRSALRLAQGGGVMVWGLAEPMDPAGGALVAGMAGGLLQLQDVYLPTGSHPSSAVIPAAWSTLQASSSTDPGRFLTAIAAGYEVANRFAEACMPVPAPAHSAATGMADAVGAAVAAAMLRGLGGGGIARAVSNAAFMLPATAFASSRAHPALTPLSGGLAARAGYEAASLARDAGAGRRVVEDDGLGAGVLELLGGVAAKLEPEGWRGETIDAVAWKFFPACIASHGVIEAVLSLGRIDVAGVERIVIRRAAGVREPGGRTHAPERGLVARLTNLRWVVARAVELGHFRYPDAVADEQSTLTLAGKVELEYDAALDTPPPILLAADVEIHFRRGHRRVEYRRSVEGQHGDRGARGWTSTLDDTGLREKYQRLAGGTPVAGEAFDALEKTA